MKSLLFALCFAASFYASAAPTLVAAPLPASGPQPASMSITVNGSPGPACTLTKAADASVQASCDMVSLPVPGVYNIIATYTYVSGCVNSANAATCQNGGVASSAPFNFTRLASPATGPALLVSP
jgi:hypothetical protein